MAEATGLLVPLSGDGVLLEPLAERHREALRAACADDEDFWPLYPRSFGLGHFDASFDEILAAPDRLPFALFAGDGLVGMSGYLNPAPPVVEIGGTYLMPAARGTGLNALFKQVLIDHAAACGFGGIVFRIDARNARSRAAVLKLGAVQGKTIPAERVIWTGHVRDTVLFHLALAPIG